MSAASYRRKLLLKIQYLSPSVVLVILALGTIGCLMMYSAGGGNFEPWAVRHLERFVIGIILMLMVALTAPATLLRYAYVFYGLCLMVLIGVEVAGYIGKGAQRWVELGGVNLQPSELMKLATILALARYFHTLSPTHTGRLMFLLPPLLLVGLPVLLILKQPNLGTATILTAVATVIFFIAGVKLRYFIIVGVLVISALPVGWHFLHDYQKQRVMTFMNPEADPLGSGYNIMQSMIAIGSGGIAGKGFLHGSQGQLDFLPEKQTDFIFTMLAEEFGFIGCLIVLLLYTFLIVFGTALCMRSRSLFGSILAIGVTAMLFVHLWINIAMVMGLIPVVGVPLPMLSYGGSILVTMMLGFGLLLNAYVNRDLSMNRSSW